MDYKTKLIGVIAILLIVGAIIGVSIWIDNQENKPGQLDTFASCLGEKGAKFYGAFWCPHCNNQKKLFGSSKRLLPYVECSTPDAQGQLEVCNQIGIESYPTWIFADNEEITGEVPLERLAEKTGCALPPNIK